MLYGYVCMAMCVWLCMYGYVCRAMYVTPCMPINELTLLHVFTFYRETKKHSFNHFGLVNRGCSFGHFCYIIEKCLTIYCDANVEAMLNVACYFFFFFFFKLFSRWGQLHEIGGSGILIFFLHL